MPLFSRENCFATKIFDLIKQEMEQASGRAKRAASGYSVWLRLKTFLDSMGPFFKNNPM